ncbi:hypothetical protein GCM10027565_28140 [Bordetella tumulicola]
MSLLRNVVTNGIPFNLHGIIPTTLSKWNIVYPGMVIANLSTFSPTNRSVNLLSYLNVFNGSCLILTLDWSSLQKARRITELSSLYLSFSGSVAIFIANSGSTLWKFTVIC